MPITLEHIVAATREKVAQRLPASDLSELDRRALQHNPRGFRRALEAKSKQGTAIIAELKKASPSRGVIRADFHVGSLALELEVSGAAALSVLTDEDFFQGSLENLRLASAKTKLPCLRKDFIVDEFQLLEARANCADAILLIVAALSQAELETLARRAAEWELDVLCEAHDEVEVKRAVDAGCRMIGVNNRNLKTFDVDLENAIRLSSLIPRDVFPVAESGINDGSDIHRLRVAGYKAFLIGESLMRAPRPGESLSALLTAADRPTANGKRQTTV